MPKSKKKPTQKTADQIKSPSKVLEMELADVFIASSAKQRTYIEQVHFTPRNFTQKHLGTICGFFMVRDKSPWSAHIVHFLNAEFKKEYFSQSKRSLSESFTAALHHTNRALSELAKNDNINWIGMLDSVLCVYDETSIHFSVTGEGTVLLLRDGELADISVGLAPEGDSPNPLKTFVDTASGKLIGGDKIILTSHELLTLVPIHELEKNLARFDDEEFFQFVTTVLTNESPMASTQIITVKEKVVSTSSTIPQSQGIISNIDLPIHKKVSSESEEIIMPENAFSAKEYGDTTKKEPHYIPNEDTIHKSVTPVPAKKNISSQNSNKKRVKPLSTDEYVDKRTGHIYVSGEVQEQPDSAMAPYIENVKDFYSDCLYNIKQWSHSIVKNFSYFTSQMPVFFTATSGKIKALLKSKVASEEVDSVDEIIDETPVELAKDTTLDDKKEASEKTSFSSLSTPTLSVTDTTLKSRALGLLGSLKIRLKQLELRENAVSFFTVVKKSMPDLRSKITNSPPPVSAVKNKATEDQIEIEQEVSSVSESLSQKKPSLWKMQESTKREDQPSEKMEGLEKSTPPPKEQKKFSKKISTPAALPDDHFSALDDLYKNQETDASFDTMRDTQLSPVEKLLGSVKGIVRKTRNLFPTTATKDYTETKDLSLALEGNDKDRQKMNDSGNGLIAFITNVARRIKRTIDTLQRYITAWKFGHYVIKGIIGLIFIVLVVIPLYKKITSDKEIEEAEIVRQEEAFEENLNETVQEELTIPEPTKTVLDPTLVSADRGASHSALFKGTPFFAAGTSLLSLTGDSITTTPLPGDAGSIKHLMPIDDLNLIFFLTDTNLLYAYNPSTDIFTKQDITEQLDHADIAAFGSYQQKFYIGKNDGIIRFDREIGGFDNATEWITDGTPISNLTSLTVDGSIFVAKDGDILKFEGGNLSPLSSPDNIQANFVYKTQEMDHLWVLDSVNFTISKLDPETLESIEAYVHEDLRDATSFSVDEEASIAYLTQDDTITSLSLEITQ